MESRDLRTNSLLCNIGDAKILRLALLAQDDRCVLNPGAGEIFLHKVHLIHLETLSVQVFQGTGFRGEGEGQLVGIERLVIPVKPLVQLAVFAVTQQWMTGVGKLGTDLMGAAVISSHSTRESPFLEAMVL